MKKIPMRLTRLQERYLGVLTGRIIYHSEVRGCHPLGNILGRGYNPRESLIDFTRRARDCGREIKTTQLEVVEELDRV